MEREDVVDLFAPIAQVSVRRMFGGLGVWLDGLMFALVASGEVYLKSDEETDPLFDEVGAEPFTFNRHGKPIIMSYRHMPAACFDDTDMLELYAHAAIGASRRAAARKPAKPARTRRRSDG